MLSILEVDLKIHPFIYIDIFHSTANTSYRIVFNKNNPSEFLLAITKGRISANSAFMNLVRDSNIDFTLRRYTPMFSNDINQEYYTLLVKHVSSCFSIMLKDTFYEISSDSQADDITAIMDLM